MDFHKINIKSIFRKNKKHSDIKGTSIAILHLPNGQTIVRKNIVVYGTELNIKLFGIEFDSWHAEMRLIYSLLKNTYYLKQVMEANLLEITVIRITKAGKLATCSKPCDKCIAVLKNFKKKYIPYGKVIIHYHKNSNFTVLEL